MRIAQVAPLFESVPPKCYGGTERIVYHLTEGLVELGHEVTLFATGDSQTSARLIPTGRTALRFNGCRDSLAPHAVQFERLRQNVQDYDVVHLHTDVLHLGLAQTLGKPTMSTLHGRLDLPEYRELYETFRHYPLTSISLSQRRPVSFANWVGNVYHGLDPKLIEFTAQRGDYLAFLGRISPEKGFDRAVEIARRSGMRLKVAAKIDKADWDYYQGLKSLFDEPFVEFIGEISDRDKPAFLGQAAALLFPIQWPEPFGIVMIESMAAGTPVIAFKNGSVPEVIREGVSGFIVESDDEAVAAVKKISQIDRRACRREFDERFTRQRMAKDYVRIYQNVMKSWSTELERAEFPPSRYSVGGTLA